MKIQVSCQKQENAVCPNCGSKNILGIGKEYCHCGQCGAALEVNIVEKVMNNEERDPEDVFTQMSLFG